MSQPKTPPSGRGVTFGATRSESLTNSCDWRWSGIFCRWGGKFIMKILFQAIRSELKLSGPAPEKR